VDKRLKDQLKQGLAGEAANFKAGDKGHLLPPGELTRRTTNYHHKVTSLSLKASPIGESMIIQSYRARVTGMQGDTFVKTPKKKKKEEKREGTNIVRGLDGVDLCSPGGSMFPVPAALTAEVNWSGGTGVS